MPVRKASVVWEGTIREGKGTYHAESGISGPYTFSSRFESGTGSNPEELLAAAEAACFSMALSGNLQRNGATPTRIETDAACTVEREENGFTIKTMALTVRASASNIDAAKFQEVAQQTKETCPVSRAIKGNVQLTLDAQLV